MGTTEGDAGEVRKRDSQNNIHKGVIIRMRESRALTLKSEVGTSGAYPVSVSTRLKGNIVRYDCGIE